MKLQWSKSAGRGVIAVIHMASEGGRRLTGQKLAADLALPAVSFLKLLQQLSRSGILASERGPGGGFWLQRSPEEITVLDVVEALDGPLRSEIGFFDGSRASVQIERIGADAAQRVRAALAELTLASLVSSDALRPGEQPPSEPLSTDGRFQGPLEPVTTRL